ncbi:MAG: hypothetical protein ACI9QL_004286 [Candidatus Omnitrophota bacterium]
MKHRVHHLLAGLFILGCIGWTFHEPYAPGRVSHAIPSNAAYYSRHFNFADQWPALMRNPAIQGVLVASGVEEDALSDLATNPTTLQWLHKLAGDEANIAWVPAMGYEQKPAWLVSSWVGGRGYRLRYLLAVTGLKEFESQARYRGRQIWKIDLGEAADKPHLTVSIAEGVLIGCYSEDPQAIHVAIDSLDGLQPDLGDLAQGSLRRLNAWSPGARTRGFFYLPSATFPQPGFFRLDEIDEHHFTGTLQATWLHTRHAAFTPEHGINQTSRLLGDIPLGVIMVPTDLLAELCSFKLLSNKAQVYGTLLNHIPTENITLALLGDDYKGNLKEIGIPSLILAVKCSSPEQGPKLATACIETMNALHKLGLRSEQLTDHARPVFALQGTGDEVYSYVKGDDRAGYALLDDLLVIGSHLGPLRRLADRYDTEVATFEARQGRWLPELFLHHNNGFLWMDVAKGSKTLREAIAAYKMSLLFDDPIKNRKAIKDWENTGEWLKQVEPVETLRLWHNIEAGDNQIQFSFGVPNG